MIKTGITGGIGSGKSVVSTILAMEGIPVYKADDESKRLCDTSPIIKESLKSLIDRAIYADEKLDRRRLASIIFSDEALLMKVNEIIHPVVRQDFMEWADKQEADCCALESAILFESGFNTYLDVVLMIYAPVGLRLTRAMLRDGASEAEIMKRMNRQMPDHLKRKQANVVIINDDVQPLLPQMDQFIRLLQDTYMLTSTSHSDRCGGVSSMYTVQISPQRSE
jgi:dephospho-CoA kinase